jgi:hypothetical protein
MILLDQILQDVRFAARQLRKSWVFTSSRCWRWEQPGASRSSPLWTARSSSLYPYIPFEQEVKDNFALVVRTGVSDESLLPQLAATIRQIDPAILSYRGVTMMENTTPGLINRDFAVPNPGRPTVTLFRTSSPAVR